MVIVLGVLVTGGLVWLLLRDRARPGSGERCRAAPSGPSRRCRPSCP